MSTPMHVIAIAWAFVFCAVMIWGGPPCRQMLGAIGFPLSVLLLRAIRREYWQMVERGSRRPTAASSAPAPRSLPIAQD